jgi:zinc D-Ala-D-Ala carboxypeptidase
MNWNYKNFKREEMTCKHCGAEGVKPELMEKLQELRNLYGKPMSITSAYRCPQHPVEKSKSAPGAHALGLAADVAVQGADAHKLLSLAFQVGFAGVGVQQKGSGRFIHLDVAKTELPRPTVWSY